MQNSHKTELYLKTAGRKKILEGELLLTAVIVMFDVY